MRLQLYTMASAALAVFAVYNAYNLHNGLFFPTCIYLAKNSASFMILMNVMLLSLLYLGKGLQVLFIGPLRVIEVEHLYERAWFSVSETLLAMTIFRNDFDARFIFLFALLILIKCFHWLSADRVEYMEQTPSLPHLFYPRLISLMVLLFLSDFVLLRYTYSDIVANGASMMYMYAFEYFILSATIVATGIRFAVYAYDHSLTETVWDDKSVYLFYLDLILDFIKLSAYMGFFVAVLQEYGLPIHIIRDLYFTTRSFIRRIKEMIQYRQATINMNERYPTATEEELAATDRVCIICREEMNLADNPKKLPCGHIFHFRCLRSWLERQQTCPTCRQSVLTPANDAAPRPARNQDEMAPQPPEPEQGHNPPETTPPPQPPAGDSGDSMSRSDSSLPRTGPITRARSRVLAESTEVSGSSMVRLIPLFSPGQPMESSGIADLKSMLERVPANVSALPTEELRKMEGSSREALQHRLRLLERLKQKIDADSTDIVTQLAALERLAEVDVSEAGPSASSGHPGDEGAEP